MFIPPCYMYSLYFATRHLQNFRRHSHDAFYPITKRHSTPRQKKLCCKVQVNIKSILYAFSFIVNA